MWLEDGKTLVQVYGVACASGENDGRCTIAFNALIDFIAKGRCPKCGGSMEPGVWYPDSGTSVCVLYCVGYGGGQGCGWREDDPNP